MTNLRLVAGLLTTLAMVPSAQAQVSLDVSKITCEQFVLAKVTDPEKIAIWLSGYYNAKRNNAVIDVQGLESNTAKLRDYCRKNYQVPVMQAVEAVFKTGN